MRYHPMEVKITRYDTRAISPNGGQDKPFRALKKVIHNGVILAIHQTRNNTRNVFRK